jgi:hypothetical protein
MRQALGTRAEELVRARPLAPGGGWDWDDMHVEFMKKLLTCWPAPSSGWVHHLDEATMAVPGDHEMDNTVRMARHNKRWEELSCTEQDVIDRHHHLLGLKTELHSDLLHGID